MSLFNIFKKDKENPKEEAKKSIETKSSNPVKSDEADKNRIKRWNLFIEDVCCRDEVDLTDIQKKVVICFWYDAEVQNGGHCGYFECYPDTDPNELSEAIREIGTDEMANNYLNAVNSSDEESNCWEAMDSNYYTYSPSLCDYIEEYVEAHRLEMYARRPNTVPATWGWYYDDAANHKNKVPGLMAPEKSEYNHIAIFLRWMAEHDLLSTEVLKCYPELLDTIKNSKLDLRDFIRKTPEFRGMICPKHFNKKGEDFAEKFYCFTKEDGYPACVDAYATNYFGEEKYNNKEFKNEAYLFVPYDEAYYKGLSKYIDSAWDRLVERKNKAKDSIDKQKVIDIVSEILHAFHEKRYKEVQTLVDSSEIDNLEEFLLLSVEGTLKLNGYRTIDEYGVNCNFSPEYEFSQLDIGEYNDGSGFWAEYQMTSDGELTDLVLQLKFEYEKNGQTKCIFENVDFQ